MRKILFATFLLTCNFVWAQTNHTTVTADSTLCFTGNGMATYSIPQFVSSDTAFQILNVTVGHMNQTMERGRTWSIDQSVGIVTFSKPLQQYTQICFEYKRTK